MCGLPARQCRPHRRCYKPPVRPVPNVECAACSESNRGDAVQRSLHQPVERTLAPFPQRPVPRCGKAFRPRPRAQGIGRLAAHPHHPRRRRYGSGNTQRAQKCALARNRPPVVAGAGKRNRGKGGRGNIGRARRGVVRVHGRSLSEPPGCRKAKEAPSQLRGALCSARRKPFDQPADRSALHHDREQDDDIGDRQDIGTDWAFGQ